MEKDPIILLLLLLICSSCYSQYADPCENFTVLDNIESRHPTTTGNSLTIDDRNLSTGWYAAPRKWKLLSRDPGKGSMCGNSSPFYRKTQFGPSSLMCLRTFDGACTYADMIRTRMCGGREIYRLKTMSVRTAYCFVSKLDILIVEDVSRSIGKPNFDEMKRFQESMVNSTIIGRDAVNVALIAFSSNARVVFRFTEYSNNKSGVLAALQQQTYEEGPSTNIGDAIKLATSTIINGDRNDADSKVIMFTDGCTTMEDREAIAASIGSLKAKAEVFVVAISEVDANSTIHLIASGPSNVIQIGSPDAASAVVQKMMAP
ncbi:collagen alpha-1(XII) chain-like [Haliotis cracherodii]|uniref:collagen alpha-1(XII) chain-like n=1 Tax=Haliotis cracherodii TaxID=6455 RepID=UPI0039EB2A6D